MFKQSKNVYIKFKYTEIKRKKWRYKNNNNNKKQKKKIKFSSNDWFLLNEQIIYF